MLPDGSPLFRQVDRLLLGVYRELAVDARRMGLDRVGGNEKLAGDDLGAAALGPQSEHLVGGRGISASLHSGLEKG